jgi:raffinose synthase
MEQYESALAYPVQSPGVTGNQLAGHRDGLASCPCWGWAWCTRFYDELHSYLASCGVDGASRWTRRTSSRPSARGTAAGVSLEASVATNFPDNGCASCMCRTTNTLYSARQTARPTTSTRATRRPTPSTSPPSRTTRCASASSLYLFRSLTRSD